ncbi:hypothetical protein SAMN05216464_108169 [Mucilaginibacter pineti]|uniref:DoxX family protein n=1 Tax=Mucilaginibacter pineti TaxID=1391627 RepID=A0A1G7EVF8_9SPHI|nr:hypothetical protein [Mucilaginibacter pineti]SDE67415.1 hypothetical protein SAMN05216464_108169 [Mucilaginibacter pineti]
MSDLIINPATQDIESKSKPAKPVIKQPWTLYQKVAFRVGFLYMLFLCIPLYSAFYQHVFGLKFSKITYNDFQTIVAFWPPQIITIESEEGVFGILNYINLILLFAGSIVGAGIWTLIDRKTLTYDKLYYWIRVLARYRLAYGMIGWGCKKIFPMQMVYPTVGMLNTPFIDMAEKKLYWSHVGVSFGYTVFLGFAEFIPGLLLLHRKTAVLGAALAAVVTFNICIANHAYDAGVAVPAAYFAIIGIFITWYDLPKIWQLIVNEKDVIQPYKYYPVLTEKWQQRLRTGVQTVFNFLFVPLTVALWGYGFFYGNNYNIPSTPGLQGTKGYYEVTEFRLNNKLIPYNPKDSLRWQDATFESWSSLSYKTNRGAIADRMIGYSPLRVTQNKNKKLNEANSQTADNLLKKKKNRDLGVTRWEVGGMAGERRYFFYKADTVKHILYLQNKNIHYPNERQVLHYSRPSVDRIILSGVNEFKDSIYVVLDRSAKQYPLVAGRQGNVTAF